MTADELDELDRHILRELQRDARHVSSRDIAATVTASPSTIRKRIQRLEDEGVISAYRADIDYERAGYRVYFQVVCTAPIPERAAMAEEGLRIPGVIGARELATGQRNVVFTVAGEDSNDLTRIAAALSEIGLTILDEELIRQDHTGAFFEYIEGGNSSTERAD
ncbi:Lrp/AsnC family transcriptional regulator [Halobellus sp. Atlit-31R]|nr:Lrp/AsnC family transcriptional regulator [Halobellus sp. Atlit-31R]